MFTAQFEGVYLLRTMARPLNKGSIRLQKNLKHTLYAGARENDQVRFERLSLLDQKIIAPWRIWKLKSRTDLINYAKNNINPKRQKRCFTFFYRGIFTHLQKEKF